MGKFRKITGYNNGNRCTSLEFLDNITYLNRF